MAESEQGHRIRVGLFDKDVEDIFAKALGKVLPLLRGITLKEGEVFRWSDYPALRKVLDSATGGLEKGLKRLFEKAIEQEYNRGLQNKISAQNIFYGSGMQKVLAAQQKVLEAQRGKAVNAYLNRVNTGNFSLSGRIWKIGEQAKKDMATAIKAGLEDGLDYRQLARSVKEFLIDPNRLFRRVRGKDGLLHLSNAAKNYHPGQGVYRSSVRNAQRIARTETNMAYRRAECDSVQVDPFVLGIRINLSANHTTKLPNGKVVAFTDICDELSNQDYPSDFKFTGWHPHCRCYITYIMVPQDEAMEMIRKGLRYPPRSKPVSTVPPSFTRWIASNRSRLEKSTSLPYFVRDNQKYIHGINYTPEGLEQIRVAQGVIEKSEPTTLEKAAIRHAARTPEQVAGIQKRWHDRQMWNKHAKGILDLTDGVKDGALEKGRQMIGEALTKGQYEKASKQASVLRNLIRTKLNAYKDLDLNLDDLKKYTPEQIDNVAEAVLKKLLSWPKDTATQKKKLEFEIDWVEKNKKYSTWELAKKGYQKALQGVLEKIKWEEADNQLASIKAYSAANPKSKKIADLIAAAEEIKAKGGDPEAVKAKIAEAEKVKAINEASKISKAKAANVKAIAKLEAQKKAIEQEIKDLQAQKITDPKDAFKIQAKIDDLRKKLKELESPFGEGAYSQERKDKAIWSSDKGDINRLLNPDISKYWKTLSDEDKYRLWDYTDGSSFVNEPLRGQTYSGGKYTVPQARKVLKPTVEAMTNAAAATPLRQDMWVNRGVGYNGAKGLLGVDLTSITQRQAQSLVGKEFTEHAFSSCGSAKGTGFASKPVIYNIYCPKGTEAFYSAPFSRFGGRGTSWDGELTYVGDECELIIQRGTRFRVTRIYQAYGRWYVDMEVRAQRVGNNL